MNVFTFWGVVLMMMMMKEFFSRIEIEDLL